MIYKVLTFLFIIITPFNFDIIFSRSISIFGYSISSWIIYPLLLVSFYYCIIFSLSKKKYKNKLLIFIFTFISIASILISLYKGEKILQIFNESSFFILPIVIYPGLMYVKVDKVRYIFFLYLAVFVGGLVSILGVIGVLNLGYATNQFNRSSLAVDGGLGLLGLIVSVFYILYPIKKISFKLNILIFVFSLIIVITGLSRIRISIAILVLLIYFLISFKEKLIRNSKVIKLFLSIFIISMIFIFLFPNFLQNTYLNLISRFNIIGQDNSSIYRTLEMSKQIQLFLKSPLVGVGWGNFKSQTIVDIYGRVVKMSYHNMYSTILAMGGFIFFVFFIYWFYRILKYELHSLFYLKRESSILSFLLLSSILVLGWTSAGFVKPSQIMSITIIYLSSKEVKSSS